MCKFLCIMCILQDNKEMMVQRNSFEMQTHNFMLRYTKYLQKVNKYNKKYGLRKHI